MNEKDPFDQSLHRVFAPHEPDQNLKQKALNLKARSSRKPLWVAYGAAGLAAAAASVAVMLSLPTNGLAEAVIKEAGGIDGHFLMYMILPNGRWQKVGELWTKRGKQRSIEGGADRFEFLHNPDLGYNVVWSADNGTVTIRDQVKKEEWVSPMPQILTLQNLKDFLARQGLHETPRTEKVQFNGRPADSVTFSMGPNLTNTLYADASNHRIVGWSFRNLKVWPHNPPENNYARVYVVDTKPFPVHIFDPVFNIDGAPTDVMSDRAKWQDRLSKPLKVYSVNLVPRPNMHFTKMPVGPQSVSVRSVVVNRAGDVFVLFTGIDGDYGTNVLPTTIHDSTGGRYKKGGSFLPSDYGPPRFHQFSFNGKRLEGGWFIRLGGGPLRGHISVGFKQEFEPDNKFAFTYTSEPQRISSEIPSYMPYMFLPIGTHRKWLALRTDECAEDCRRAKDFAGEEKYVRQIIALEEKGEEMRPIRGADLFCRLARALEQQGKKHEAYAEYLGAQRALDVERIDPGPWAKKEIDGGLARLKPGSSVARKP